MSDVQQPDDRETGVEINLPPVDEALAQGTSATITTPSQYELALISRDAVTAFLALPPEEQTEAKQLELTVQAAAAHGYPDIEAGFDHTATEADLQALNDYIAQIEAQMAAEQPETGADAE